MNLESNQIIVQASAGSGKTKILVDRYLNLLKSGAMPESIVCLTYTNAAAFEMKHRIRKEFDGSIDNCLIQTLHSFCLDMIAKHFDLLGLAPSPNLMQKDFLKIAFEESLSKVSFELAESMSKNKCFELIKSLNEKRNLFESTEKHPFFEFANIVFNAYDDLKHKFNVLDFHDVINFAGKLLNMISIDIEHVLVDEAQDTSEEQWKVLLTLINLSKTCFIVGDIKQSIYGFQGASPKIFANLPTKISFAKVLTMQTSYRTIQPILDVVNNVFNDMEHFEPHRSARSTDIIGINGEVILLPLTKIEKIKKPEKKPFVIEEKENKEDSSNHAKVLCDLVIEILESKKILPKTKKHVMPEDIMILVQKRGPIVWDLMRLLRSHDIECYGPVKVYLLDSLIIQDLLSIGRFVVDPHDDYNLACILKSPIIGISEDELFELCYNREGFLIDIIKEKKQEIYDFLLGFKSSNPFHFYNTLFSKLKNTILDYEDQIFIEELLDQAIQYEESDDLIRFYDHLKEINPTIKPISGNGVKIMTVHSSKGLQAPIVILADATRTPDLKKDNFFFDNGCIYLKSNNDHLKQDALTNMTEEHQRLLYVAMTRAEDFLYVSGIECKADTTWYHKIKKALNN